MKKIKYILASLLLTLIVPATNASALDVKTLTASISNTSITVSGTAEDGTVAVAIEVYEEDGTTIIAGPESTAVDSSNAFSYTFTGDYNSSSTYVIKAADYDGGDYTVYTLSPNSSSSSSSSTSSSTASTGDTGTAPKSSDSEDRAVRNISLGTSIIIASAILYGAHLVIKRNKK